MEDEQKKTEEPVDQPAAAPQRPETQVSDETVRKLIFSLCYIFGILFFLPLVVYKDDAEGRRHANQGLVLLLFSVVGNVVFGILTVIPVIGLIFTIVASLYSLALLILGIIGIVYVCTDKKQDLPLIGGIKLIK